MKNTPFTLIFLLLTSCNFIAKTAYGVKKPRPVTNEQVIVDFRSLPADEYELYRPSSDTTFSKLTGELGLKIPGILFFDATGRGISIHEDTVKSCTANAYQLIQRLDELAALPRLSTHKEEVLRLVKRINLPANDQVVGASSSTPVSYKYTIIVSWATFAGKKLNREKTLDWIRMYEQLDEITRQQIDFKIINLDPLIGMG